MAQLLDFTIAAIKAIQPPASGRAEYKDTDTPGLYLRVTAAGVKSFSFVGRAKGSTRVERVTFGKFPTVKPEEARTKAKQLAGQLAGGVSAAAASRQRRGEPTLGDLHKEYRQHLIDKGRGTEQLDAAWELYIAPSFAKRKLSEIKATDLERWHRGLPALIQQRRNELAAAAHARRLAKRQEAAASRAQRRRGPDPKPLPERPAPSPIKGHRMANVALQRVAAMYAWAAEPRRALFTGENPAVGHELFPEPQRERFLQPHELAPFFKALAEEPSATMRDFILVALLTGARRSNVAAMEWKQLDLERAEWRVAGELMKNGQPQTITLTPEAVAILKARNEGTKSPYVFPSALSESGHIEDPRKAWRRVMRAASLSDIRIHDLRRTLGSWQARTGASLVLIGKSLNHKDQAATTIYARLDLDPVRQSVERATSAMFEAAGVKDTATVVALPGGAARPAAVTARPAKARPTRATEKSAR